MFSWKHCGRDVRACCYVSVWLDRWERAACYWLCMLSFVHISMDFPMSFMQFFFLTHFVALPCVSCSPHRDIGREGSVLPRSGLGSGSVILLPSHPQEHHQTDLLLQSSWESLGTRLPEMSLLWIRLVNCPWNFK